jgi:hypothetical protein
MVVINNNFPANDASDIRLFNSSLKMPLVKLPLTTSLISTPNGKILLSPHPALTATEFQSMGDVTDIVAPNLFHHLGIPAAIAAHPTARLWGSAGLEQKRPDIKWGKFLDKHTWPHQSEFTTIQLAGMPKINEFIFFHPKSRTIFITDFCFNLSDNCGFGGWLLYNIFGTYNRFAISRIFTRLVQDRTAFQRSIATLFACDFDNIVVSHGLAIVGGGKAKLQAALIERGYSI